MAHEPASEPNDFFATLVREHAEIETRLAALEGAAHAVARVDGDPAARAVIADTLRFFATDAARHQDLEERTLFPRLRSRPEFKQIVGALEFQHGMNDDTERELAARLGGFVAGRGRELRLLALRFVELHRGHAVAEERALFPLAAATLSARELAEMGREMRDRSGASSAAAGRR